MTTRIEMLNSHTSTERIRVREVQVEYGDGATVPRLSLRDGAPPVEAQPGQKVTGKIGQGNRALLIELVNESSPAEREAGG